MKIYVSSTSVDLAEYRAAVMTAIRGLGHICIAMEDYVAEDQLPVKKCLQDVALCDLYIGIFAWRYGFIPEGYEQSITELEYRTAIERGIPTLIFLLDEDAAWPPKYLDRGEQRKRVEALRDELKQKKLVGFFDSPDDLRAKASQAIAKVIPTVRTRFVVEPKEPAKPKVSLLRLPQTGKAQFGRDQAMKRLDDAWESGRTNIATIVAWAGVGKSALINSWLAGLAKENFRGAKSVFGWSFYNQETDSQEASADVFTAEALQWFGDPHPNFGSPWEKGQRLAELVQAERSILILDGLEVLQQTKRPEEGKLKDQALQALLQNLAWQNPGLCVIATRLSVTEMQSFIGDTVEELLLDHLTADEGTKLLVSLGVHGTKEEMIEAVTEFDGHPLALTLLGSYLVEFYNGVVSRWREVNQPEPDQVRRIMRSYERMLGQGPELDILQLLGLFDGPAHLGALSDLRKPPAISGLTDSFLNLPGMKWNAAVAKLRQLKLVAERHREKHLDRPDVIDSHPLVRQHFSEKLRSESPEAWKEANNRLFEYYKNLPKQESPDTLAEMAYLFQAVTHGCRAGRHQEAWDEVYWPRIRREEDGYSVLSLGAYGADLVALTNFFDEYWEQPWDNPVSSLTDLAKARVFTETAFDLRGLGRLQEAIPTQRAGVNLHCAQEGWWSAADAAGNLSEMLATFGDLEQATADAELSIELAEKSGDQKLLVTNIATLADALHQRGQFEASENRFREAEALYRQVDPSIPYLHAMRGYHFCDLLLGKGSYEEVLERANASLRVDQQRPFAMALARLTLARMHMLKAQSSQAKDFSEASEGMKQSLSELRLAGHQELVVRGLLASAELSRLMELYDQAEATLREAYATVLRDQMRLHQADAYLQYAYLFLALGRINLARENFMDAKQYIQAMGYHRRDEDLRLLAAKLASS